MAALSDPVPAGSWGCAPQRGSASPRSPPVTRACLEAVKPRVSTQGAGGPRPWGCRASAYEPPPSPCPTDRGCPRLGERTLRAEGEAGALRGPPEGGRGILPGAPNPPWPVSTLLWSEKGSPPALPRAPPQAVSAPLGRACPSQRVPGSSQQGTASQPRTTSACWLPQALTWKDNAAAQPAPLEQSVGPGCPGFLEGLGRSPRTLAAAPTSLPTGSRGSISTRTSAAPCASLLPRARSRHNFSL